MPTKNGVTTVVYNHYQIYLLTDDDCVLLWVSNIYTLLVGVDISALISAQRLDLFKIVMDKNWFSLSGIGSSEKRNMHAGSFETC